MMQMTMMFSFRCQGHPMRVCGRLPEVPLSYLIPTTATPIPQGTAIELETGATVQLQ